MISMFDKKSWMKEYEKTPERKAKQKQWLSKHPEITKKRNSRRIKYKGKMIHVKENPRTGMCQKCGNIEQQTQMHHFAEYHDEDPLKDTIELCVRCHRHEHKKVIYD